MTLTLKSPAFPAGAMLPKRFTCDGEDASPPRTAPAALRKAMGGHILAESELIGRYGR